jgi:hypothetical protein
MIHWRIAAEQPPHLTCIAPWEGTGDLYRESHFKEGVNCSKFGEGVAGTVVGNGYIDDFTTMAVKYPLINEYREEKIRNLKISKFRPTSRRDGTITIICEAVSKDYVRSAPPRSGCEPIGMASSRMATLMPTLRTSNAFMTATSRIFATGGSLHRGFAWTLWTPMITTSREPIRKRSGLLPEPSTRNSISTPPRKPFLGTGHSGIKGQL